MPNNNKDSNSNAEEALKQSELKYRTLVDKSQDGIFIMRDSKIVFVNEAFAKIAGYMPDEIIGKDYKELFATEDQEKVENRYRKRLAGETVSNEYELRMLHKDKNKMVLVNMTIGVIMLDGKLSSMGTIKDITERKKLEEDLIRSEKLSAVGQLATGVAHEFNNILAIIKGYAQLLTKINKSVANDKELYDSLKIIEKQSMRGAKIASSLMAFSRPLSPKKEPCDISEIINDVLAMQKKPLELENISIISNYNHHTKLNLDKDQFQQVFLNLILNARQAIQPKGKGQLNISTEESNNKITIKMGDTGIGMNEDTRSKIFVPFFTTKGAMAKDDLAIQGSGLGLAIVHTIIQNHNGTIDVESEQDKGSTFIITLPIYPAP